MASTIRRGGDIISGPRRESPKPPRPRKPKREEVMGSGPRFSFNRLSAARTVEMRTTGILVVLCFIQFLPAFPVEAAGGGKGKPPSDTRSPAQLLKVIQDHERKWEERRDCAMALADHPKYDSKAVLPLLKSADAATRMLGAIALRGGAKAAVPELLRVLQKDPNGSVQFCAALSLGKIGDRRAVPELLRILQKDPNGSVQFCAALSLGKIGDRRAVPVLIRLAEAKKTHYRAREGVVSALAEISDPRATDTLVRIVKTEVERTGKTVGPWREALHGLRKLGNAKAVEALGEAATKCPHKFVGQRASSLLRKLDNPDGLERLGQLALKSKNPGVRNDAIQGLGNFNSKRAVAILLKAYRQEPKVRSILRSLGRTGHKDAVPILLGVVLDNDERRECRHEAANALSLVGRSSVPSLLRAWEKVKGRPADRDIRRALLHAMSGIADKRLLPAWKDVFDIAAPTARKSRWWDRRIPEWEILLGRFEAGMMKIGKDALPCLEQLHQLEEHDLLRKRLARLIKEIKGRKSKGDRPAL